MKKHMKKVLSLLLCALMIVTAALPVFAAGETETDPKVAITEIAPNPAGGAKFEYVEIMNTTNEVLNLKDYHIYRFMFSHGGKSAYDGFGQIMASNTSNCYSTTAISLANCDKKLEKDVPVLVWFKVDDSTVSNFVTYWNNQIENSADYIDADDVFAVDVSNYLVEAIKTNGQYGSGFLPDSKCGYVLSLISNTFATEDASTLIYGTAAHDSSETYDKTRARHAAADSLVVIYQMGAAPGKVANRYAFYDAEGYNAAYAKAKAETGISTHAPDYCRVPGLMMPRYTPEGEVDLQIIQNTVDAYNIMKPVTDATTGAVTKALLFLHAAASEDPSPAKLVAGQFDPDYTYTPAQTTANGISITEVCASTGEGSTRNNYEFVEITNTSDVSINLSNYTVFLFGGTNSGAYMGTYPGRMILSDSDGNSQQFSYAQITTNKTLAPNEVAVIVFTDNKGDASVTNEPTVESFTNYWANTRNSDMTGVTVVEAEYYLGDGIKSRGNGFLPDVAVGYSLMLFDDTKSAVQTSFNSLKDAHNKPTHYNDKEEAQYTALPKEYTQVILENSDSIALIIANGKNEQNVSCNFYNYIDIDRYEYDAERLAQIILAIKPDNKYINAIIDSPANVVVAKNQPLRMFYHASGNFGSTDRFTYNTGNTEGTVYVDSPMDSVPTPGKLLDGQFGYEADKALISVAGYQTGTTATDGATDVRILGNLNIAQAQLENYTEIGIEVAAASDATDDCLGYAINGNTFANSVCTKQVGITTDKVYKTITDGAGNLYTNGDKYMFAINLAGIPVKNCNLTFRVYVKDAQGNKTYTGFYQITDTSI